MLRRAYDEQHTLHLVCCARFEIDTGIRMQHFTGLLGVLVILTLAYAFSTNRRAINPRTVVAGVAVQIVFTIALFKFPPLVSVFTLVASVVSKVISFADDGTRFLFGNAADASGAWGFIFAVKVLPTIIFFAAVMSVLYHLGIMQRVISVVAVVIRWLLGITGVEAVAAAANIFVGQTEAPLTVRPFIARMTRSQLVTVMTGGFATIAGSVMAAYIVMIGGEDPVARVEIAKHFIAASLLSTPAAIVLAKMLYPETERPPPETPEALRSMPCTTTNVIDAVAEGATDGLKLALNVAAMLVAFVSIIALLNWPVSALGEALGYSGVTVQGLLGYCLWPMAWLMGAGDDAHALATLMGTSVVATEFVAYLDLSRLIEAKSIAPHTSVIAIYALCGFANLPSIAIQIGGLGAMAPERRSDLAQLGLRAMIAGAMACWMTGAIAGVFAR